MTTKTAQGVIRPNFNHRLNASNEPLENVDLINSLELVASRAEGVIAVLGDYLLQAEDTIKPDYLYFALESVRQDLLDVKSIGAALMAGLVGVLHD